MGMNPHANGGELLVPLAIPHFDDYAVRISAPGSVEAESTRVLGVFLRDVMKLNLPNRNFRVFGPDETASNRLDAVYEASGKEWMARVEDVDINLKMMVGSWRSSASTSAKAGSKDIFSPAATDFFLATRHSPTSSTPCSISMRNG
jgi:hypothetical protein